MSVLREGSGEFERRRAREKGIIQEGESLWRTKQRQNWIDRLKDQREARDLLSNYNPWGRPGCGAPTEDLRKRKFIDLKGPIIPALDMGRPGAGAPLRTKSGKMQTVLKMDPAIRFQDPAKKCVEIEMRYRASPTQQNEYKTELDAMVTEKRKLQGETWRNCNQEIRKMGWSNSDPNLSYREEIGGQRTSTDNHENCTTLPKVNQGQELVPLLKERHFDILHSRHPLNTTDVTRLQVRGFPEARHLQEDHDMVQTLRRQVMYKQKKLEELRRREVESCQMHFETWTKFWGRPGHGAPRKNTLLPKFNVDEMLDSELKDGFKISTFK
ncbi:uncharacterized protein LOC132203350 [Neocloeon triangulifer]|uniref:uncharacterized protein LOC132203350 n=1 Tax=Neocloeon triangulifer TaxID=2078957 RepID=UPI00286FAADE|nr:uncharacterized protein LOC132203350 [Neocloeon triangulifer]